MSDSRCFDCFDEFAPDAPRFAVLKQMRDWPPGGDQYEERLLHSFLFDQVMVCKACAGWYGDQALEASA